MTAGARPLADQAARRRIAEDLDTTLMVEAGAGSGKTTSLVGRMMAHVARGTPVERIAAVTFTRKAATELRERFEVALERAARDPNATEEARQRAGRAREELDRAFLGTIHAFCARLLREHPLEAGLDPAFEEVSEEDWPEIRRLFWSRWLERCRRAGEPLLDELRRIGIDPRWLAESFETFVDYPDVSFAAPDRPAPDITACRRTLEALMRRARELTPPEPVEGIRDPLQRTVRRLEFLRDTGDWTHVPAFCDALASLSASGVKVVQKRWADGKAGKALGEQWSAFLGGECATVLTAWREHRYAPVIAFLGRAAAAFERERLATGRLGFEDLLLGAARLLRENPQARRGLGERYRYLLVDEFQDTDPVQAEVCFLLASDPEQGDDWRGVTPRSGSLFVVGDPKQSIYRFRRADIQIYELVKERIRRAGDVLELTENFRSVDAIREFVNQHFETVFPAAATPQQAAFVRMETRRPGEAEDGVHRTAVTPAANNQDAIVAADAEQVASWIAQRIDLREATPGDFLVLSLRKKHLEAYARALAARNVPATLAGAGLPQELELGELLVVLRALADPANQVAVTAALEGMPFGCSHADLWAARDAGLDLSIAHRPTETESPVGRALGQLYEWWIVSQRHPPDVLLDRMLDDTGLLAYAASLPLGESRAGAMLHLVERVRTAAARNGGTLAAAIAAMEATLASATSDAPLRPGRGDAVQVMNLHKAKGLEARIVILAAPVGLRDREVTVHVRRGDATGATGGLVVLHDKRRLAQPPGWREMEAAELAHLAAERDRLRYVAATRARRELVVTQLEFQQATGPAADTSMWGPFRPTLAGRPARTMSVTEPPGRRTLATTAAELALQADAARAGRQAAGRSGLSVTTVTRAAKSDDEAAGIHGQRAGGLGPAWGRAWHRAIEAMGRGRTGESLHGFVRAIVRDERLGADDRAVEAAAARIIAALDGVRRSPDWAELAAGGFEVPVMVLERDGQVEQIVEGVADAVVRTADGWRVLDWKTDAVSDAAWEERRPQYERQVARYAELLARLTGTHAEARLRRISLEEGA